MHGAVPLGVDVRPTQSESVRATGDVELMSRARFRGGAGQRQVGLFGWPRKDQGVNEKMDKGRGKMDDTVVTYKGREIGAPQLTSPLNVLPPASRYVRLCKDRTSFDAAPLSPLKNSYDVNGNHLPTPHWQDYHTPEHTTSLPPPPTPAITLPRPRPVTSKPFADIYGNPNAARAVPTYPPIDYAAAGSLIYRPSALDRSQTRYDHVPALPKKNALRNLGEAAADTVNPRKSDMKLSVQKMQVGRKWDKLPALPPGESAVEPVVKNGDEPFDTEEILRSLRPERLSLYHLNVPGRIVDRCVGNQGNFTVPRTAHDLKDSSTDDLSIRIREWDLQSCVTYDLGVDNQLQQQERFAQRIERRVVPQEQRLQSDIRSNKETLNGLPEEDASSPESAFYAELIDSVKHYHEQRLVVQRAFKVGNVSEEYYKRQVWRHGTAMGQTVRAAAAMSRYKILTNEAEIRAAIIQPAGYAIYCALLETSDPEKWQRISSPCLPNIPQQHISTPPNTLLYLSRKIGRAIRPLISVPDNPALRTHSRHAPSTGILNYTSSIGRLGVNIPVRLQNSGNGVVDGFGPSSLRQNLASDHDSLMAVDAHGLAGSEVMGVRSDGRGDGVAVPRDSGSVCVRGGRGYAQGVFVTVLHPGFVGSAGEERGVAHAARKQEMRRERDEESTVTAWPEAKC